MSTSVSSAKCKNAKTELETWNCFITNDILDLILLYTNKYIDSISSWFSKKKRSANWIDNTELKAFLRLLYLVEKKDVLSVMHPKQVAYQNIFVRVVKSIYALSIAILFAVTVTNVLQSQLLKILINEC